MLNAYFRDALRAIGSMECKPVTLTIISIRKIDVPCAAIQGKCMADRLDRIILKLESFISRLACQIIEYRVSGDGGIPCSIEYDLAIPGLESPALIIPVSCYRYGLVGAIEIGACIYCEVAAYVQGVLQCPACLILEVYIGGQAGCSPNIHNPVDIHGCRGHI